MGWQHAIAGGQGNLVAASLKSPNFIHGSAGWQIAKDGSAEFNNITIRGIDIIASSEYVSPSGDTTGATDWANITNALASTLSSVILVAGVYYINKSITLTAQSSGLTFLPGAVLKVGTVFNADPSGCMIDVTADDVTLDGIRIQGPGVHLASQIGGISVTGAQQVRVLNPQIFEVPWYGIVVTAIQGLGSMSQSPTVNPCHDCQVLQPIIRNSGGGVYFLGSGTTSFQGECFLTAPQVQEIGSTTGYGASVLMDGLRVEDIEDILVVAPNIGTIAGAESAVHVTGACATVSISNVDVGNAANAHPSVWITSGPNGTPSDVNIYGGTVEGGLYGVEVDAGTTVNFFGVRVHQAWQSGWAFTGSPSVRLYACWSNTNNQSAGTFYDYDGSGLTAGALAVLDGCVASSAIGTATAGDVPAAIAATSQVYIYNCFLQGSGTNPSNAISGTPRIIRGTVPVNPRGSITAPLVGASPYTPPASQYDVTVYFTAVGGCTAFAVGGAAVASPPLAGVGYRVTARQTQTFTWSGTAPTVLWIAD